MRVKSLGVCFMERISPRVRRTLLAVLAGAAVIGFAAPLAAQEPGTVVAADKRVQGRSYRFEPTGETIQYALFVPSNYDPARKWPLIVGLHGAGRPYDWLMGYAGIIDFAQRDGYVMVTPLGYHPRGGFGVPRRSAPAAPPASATSSPAAAADPLPPNVAELSEKDVLNVLGIARSEFNIDPDRIYLWGHSMGGGGTYHLAAKYPDIWAGLAVAAPAPPDLSTLERFKHVPILVMHGDEDKTIPVARTRETVARMKQLGMQYVYVEVKGGDHSLFISKSREMVSKLFSFFDVARKNERGAVSQN
jgi:predicted peptidase